MKLPASSMIKVVLSGRSAAAFLVGTILSFAFAMAVILCTLGLMDGFEFSLKKALSHASGDIKITSKEGFFTSDDETLLELESKSFVKSLSSVLQIESFAITDLGSKGVLIKGIEPKSFSDITNLDLEKLGGGVAVGSQFADRYNLSLGDEVRLALASKKSFHKGPMLLDFEIKSIVTHGIFEKDMRFIYMERSILEGILNYKAGSSNLAMMKLHDFQSVAKVAESLGPEYYDANFKFAPYWSEFETLLDAVAVEKTSISLVLQLIVVVALLNIIAFVFYISEVKSQDMFMLRALGMSGKIIQNFWLLMLFFIWASSAVICYFFKDLFAYLLQNLPYLKLPGDIYVLSELQMILDPLDYIYVYGISLFWVLLIGFVTMRKVKQRSVISGLREEFS